MRTNILDEAMFKKSFEELANATAITLNQSNITMDSRQLYELRQQL